MNIVSGGQAYEPAVTKLAFDDTDAVLAVVDDARASNDAAPPARRGNVDREVSRSING